MRHPFENLVQQEGDRIEQAFDHSVSLSSRSEKQNVWYTRIVRPRFATSNLCTRIYTISSCSCPFPQSGLLKI